MSEVNMIGTPHTPETDDDKRVWLLPSGRYIFRDANGYAVQPPRDNWYHVEPTIEAALAWYEGYIEGAAVDECSHNSDGSLTDYERARYDAGDECPYCKMTVGSDGYWYIERSQAPGVEDDSQA